MVNESEIVRVPPQSGTAKDNDDIAVDATVGGVELLPANSSRKSALITNTGANPMRITTDGSAPTVTRGKYLAAGASLSLDPPYVPTNQVLAIRTGAASTTANASEVS